MNKKVFYWLDGEGDIDVNLDINPITSLESQPDPEPVVEQPVNPTIDLNNLKNEIAALKDLLSKPADVVIPPIVEPVVAQASQVAPAINQTLEVLGLTQDQQQTVVAQINAIKSQNDSLVASLQATITNLKNDLSVKQTDEASIVAQVKASYDSKFQTALSQIESLTTQITAMDDQLKIKDDLITKKDNAEFIASEIKNKPWVEDMVKTAKITTREQYVNLITPTLEAREKKIYEQTNKFQNANNVFRNINTNVNQTKTPPQEAIKSKGMEFIKDFIK